MAESTPGPSLGSSGRRSRIHFPADDSSAARLVPGPLDTPRASPLGFRTSPVRRNSPLNPQKTGVSTNTRHRVRSVDGADVFLGSRSRRAHITSFITPTRGMPTFAPAGTEDIRERGSDLGSDILSDEYRLDPRILQDVQRALRLKARREARLGQSGSVHKSAPLSPDNTLPSANSSPTRYVLPHLPSSPAQRKASVSSDIDFSPSTGGVSSLHPVPASLDNGITLDWSGFGFDRPERRWKLAGTKRKGKEKVPPLSMVVDQQEKIHYEKVTRLKATANPHTIRKAKITSEQLERRYNLINGVSPTASPSLNLAQIARWYGAQESAFKAFLEKAEPFTWLKHLDKRGTSLPDRSPWHLSALIMEEYIRAHARHDTMKTIPEDTPLPDRSPELSISPSLINVPPFLASSRTSSQYSLGPALTRKLSYEGRISFEPRVELTQNSMEVESRKSGESSYSSVAGSSSQVIATRESPLTNGRLQFRDFAPKLLRNLADDLTLDSDDASSAHNLLSDRSDPARANSRNTKPIESRGAKSELEPETKAIPSGSGGENAPDAGITLRLTIPTPNRNSDDNIPQSAISRSPIQYPQPTIDRAFGRRKARRSLPSADRGSKVAEDKRRREADEEKAYELKARLLEETTANNHRIRQLLNRISVGVREHDAAQSNAMASLGISHNSLPRELLDAFSHDPAAVTGATRRFRGWRAVDDIHKRLLRQREVFRTFLFNTPGNVPVSESVLNDPISTLVSSLEALKVHVHSIAEGATEVADVLKAVQTIHSNVKADYNSTLSHTSVVYPELSYIIALEESYKDQYQQFWEFGMDALTFLLDTVTPFWRTYGKPIGEDVRDFLAIPLYRNEFTGEYKRYSIRQIPRRSLRHWLGLVLFFWASVIVNVLQARAAISSTAHYRLQMIPYETIRWTTLPFFWIGIIIQWWAVVAELAIVLMQVGVLAWWVGWSVKIFT